MPTAAFNSASKKLSDSDEPFTIEDLPTDPSNPLWQRIEEKYNLTLPELGALHNHVRASGSAPSNKRMRLMLAEEVPFSGTEKKSLEMGKLAIQFGGLLDRESSKEELYKGLVKLAEQVGKSNLDKKDLPVLGISAASGAGKTEFLRWIFNHCCTYLPNNNTPDDTATKLLQKINAAIPHDQDKFDNMLVLFASFNQTSNYVSGEGPIVSTTVERLLRSFHGDLRMCGDSSWSQKRLEGFDCLQDIMKHFSSEKQGMEKTGFIFCIDELSNLRTINPEEYQKLMVSLLEASQCWLAHGGFCAIVAAAISIYDFGEVVLQASGRAFIPIQFPASRPVMVRKATDFVHKETDVFKGAECSLETEEFYMRVTTSLLESSVNLRNWDHIMDMKPTATRVRPPSIPYWKPDALTYDDIFLLVAQGLFEKDKWTALDKEKLDALLNRLSGSVALKPIPGGIARRFEVQSGQMMLSAWRLLDFPINEPQLFKWVLNWVLIETRKLFYEYDPAESQNMWELATMGVLELHRAMLMACSIASGRDMIPTLKEIIQDLNVQHNVDDVLIEAAASPHAAKSKSTKHLPIDVKKEVEEPCFFYSALENEKGIEGVFKGGFDTCEHHKMCIFFQMKMYKAVAPKQISDWLRKADDRAQELGYEVGSYVLQLFVTGAIEANVKDHKASWPKNCIVFGTEALKILFEPFGKGIIDELIRMKSRYII